jgi:hypothetical protein
MLRSFSTASEKHCSFVTVRRHQVDKVEQLAIARILITSREKKGGIKIEGKGKDALMEQ